MMQKRCMPGKLHAEFERTSRKVYFSRAEPERFSAHFAAMTSAKTTESDMNVETQREPNAHQKSSETSPVKTPRVRGSTKTRCPLLGVDARNLSDASSVTSDANERSTSNPSSPSPGPRKRVRRKQPSLKSARLFVLDERGHRPP